MVLEADFFMERAPVDDIANRWGGSGEKQSLNLGFEENEQPGQSMKEGVSHAMKGQKK